jgi:hypothetical protein
MTAKKQGGRTTAKGTQPANTTKRSGARTAPVRGGWNAGATPGRNAAGPAGPVRSGHHRGNR